MYRVISFMIGFFGMQILKPYIFSKVNYLCGGDKNDSEISDGALGGIEDSRGKNADRFRRKTRVQEEYYSYEEVEADVDGAVCLVDEKDLSPEGEAEENEPHVISISTSEFVKAVANGEQIWSFLFNPAYGTFVWDLTYEPVDTEYMKRTIGKDSFNDFFEESKTNAGGWVQPRYYKDTQHDIFIKIESKFNIGK